MGNIQKIQPFSHLESIMFQNVWGNFLFLQNNKPLSSNNFPNPISKNIKQVGDLFNINTEQILTLDEFNETYNCIVDFLTWEGLK